MDPVLVLMHIITAVRFQVWFWFLMLRHPNRMPVHMQTPTVILVLQLGRVQTLTAAARVMVHTVHILTPTVVKLMDIHMILLRANRTAVQTIPAKVILLMVINLVLLMANMVQSSHLW